MKMYLFVFFWWYAYKRRTIALRFHWLIESHTRHWTWDIRHDTLKTARELKEDYNRSCTKIIAYGPHFFITVSYIIVRLWRQKYKNSKNPTEHGTALLELPFGSQRNSVFCSQEWAGPGHRLARQNSTSLCTCFLLFLFLTLLIVRNRPGEEEVRGNVKEQVPNSRRNFCKWVKSHFSKIRKNLWH